MVAPDVALRTALSPSACVDRLGSVVARPVLFFSALGSPDQGPVIGVVRPAGFWLRQRISYRNSFQTVLRARVEPAADGARIVCRCGVHPLVTAFMTIWFGFLALFCAGMVVVGLSALVTGRAQTSAMPGLVGIPLLMLAFGVALVRFGRHLARDEERFLIGFLVTTLAARREDDGPATAT